MSSRRGSGCYVIAHWVVVAGLWLAACHVVFPYSAAPGEGDAVVADGRDAGAVDGSVDGPADIAGADVASDGLADGAAADGPSPDTLPPDGMPPDTLPPDVGPSPDLGSVTGACAAGATETSSWPGQEMVLCTDTAKSVDQCGAAAALCNAGGGWRLCTASEYQNRGGTLSGSSAFAWIEGCIGSSNNPHSPDDVLCSCSVKNANAGSTAWYCSDPSTGYFAYNADNVGLVTFLHCMRVGDNVPATEAKWRPRVANATTDSAMCCR